MNLEAVRNPPKLNASLFLGPYTANLALLPSISAGNLADQGPYHRQPEPPLQIPAEKRHFAPEDAREPTLIEGKGVFLPFEYLVSSSASALARNQAPVERFALPPADVLEELDKTLKADEPGTHKCSKKSKINYF